MTGSDGWERLRGSVALVTGGAGGIGAAVTRSLVSADARVVVGDVDVAGAGAIVAEMERCGGVARAYDVDVTEQSSVERLVRSTVGEYGRLDVLVNCAGLVHVTPLDDLPVELWRRVFAVNVEGPFLAIQAAAPVMRRQTPDPRTGCRGKIVNVSSLAARHGRPFLAAYGASKAALDHLSKSAALVLGDAEIATTVVYPGNVRDGMWRDLAVEVAAVEGRTPEEVAAERVFQPAEEVANVVVAVAAAVGMELNGAFVDATTDPPSLR